MSQHIGYLVAFVEKDGRISGIADAKICNHREACAALRAVRKTYFTIPRECMQIIRLDGHVRSKPAPVKSKAKR